MEVLNKIIKELSDCLVEACLSLEEFDTVNFESNKFKSVESGDRLKLEVRVTKANKSAYAWTNNLNNWKECAFRAKKLMNASDELKINPVISNAKGVSDSFINESAINAGINDLRLKGEEVITSVNARKVNVTSLMMHKSLINQTFLNSSNTLYSRKCSIIQSELECAKGSSSSGDARTSQGLDIDFNSFGNETALLCIDSLKPKKISPGRFSVVFDFNAIAQLMSILQSSLLANNVIEHNSFLEGKIGSEVLSKHLTIKDVSVFPNGVNNSRMDSEGVSCIDKDLFSKGVLKNFINDLYTAYRMNVPASGNSAGLVKRGLISPNNLVIKTGEASNDELLSDCVYVNNLMGTHTANPITGDFALNALNAFKYEKGTRIPLREVMISANVFDLLKNVVLVGKTSRFDSSLSTPLIKCENVQVVG